jgi:hypothetical protein
MIQYGHKYCERDNAYIFLSVLNFKRYGLCLKCLKTKGTSVHPSGIFKRIKFLDILR